MVGDRITNEHLNELASEENLFCKAFLSWRVFAHAVKTSLPGATDQLFQQSGVALALAWCNICYAVVVALKEWA